MNPAVFHKLIHRPKNSHKYNYGHVLIIGGSSGMVGAPFLAAQAALRVGAGLVTIASDQAIIEKLERRVVEIMTLAVDTDSAQSLSIIEDYIKKRKVSVLIVGPGLNLSASPLMVPLLLTTKLPTVIDGGGLAIVASNRKILKNRPNTHFVLTPHQGELQRFFEQSLPKNQQQLLDLAKNLAIKAKITLVLKGHPTYTITARGKSIENTTGGPALATAGTGDVLAGIIGGIIAQGINTEEAAVAAVYLHGKAGDIAAELKSEPGVIASDVIDCLPIALKAIESIVS
jgi:hydroxyethylthiazole kinase-like uncharacterized protein yjeF